MAKRRRQGPDMLWRTIQISSFSARISLETVQPKGQEPYVAGDPWLELQGTATEPVGEVRDVKISMFVRERPQVGFAGPPSIGSLIQAKPHLDFVLSWPSVDFDRVWGLAISGRLSHSRLHFTKPYYGKGLIMNASFSTEAEE